MENNKIKVLFLCTGNSARSQMAQAYLNHLAGDYFEAYSAGLNPSEIHPLTHQVMNEEEISLENHSSKHLNQYMGKVHFGYLITVCSDADENCPSTFPGMGKRLHWDIEDPAAFNGTDQEKVSKFREIRAEIQSRIRTWIMEKGFEL